MKPTSPRRNEFRNSRTSAAILLALFTFASPLAPLFTAAAQTGGAARRPAGGAGRQSASKGEQTGGGEETAKRPVLAAPHAVTITATKDDGIVNHDANPANNVSKLPGDIITYTVKIKNEGSDPANNVVFTDNITDANLTLVPGSIQTQPVARDDAFNVLGNVRINVGAADGLLDNDVDPDGTTPTITSAPTTSVRGGNVTVDTTTGAFTYNPPAGYEGPDSFQYTISDGASNDTATVNLTVAGMIWFIKNDATACTTVSTASGCGRLTNPLTTLAAFELANGGATANGTDVVDPEAGDNIFIYAGTGDYTGPLTLENAQKLIGQGATDTLVTISGVTVPPHSDPLPGTTEDNAANQPPTISNAVGNGVVLAQNNVLRGFTVGGVATVSTKISGAGFGQLTVGKTTEPDVALIGNGRALFLQNGTLEPSSGFNGVASTGSSGAAAILLTQITAGTVSFFDTDVAGATAGGVEVNNSSVNVNFGDTDVNTGGTFGVTLANNAAGTRTFGALSITGGTQIGFRHFDPDGGGAGVGGGATTFTGAMTVTNPGGNGIDVQDSNVNLSFPATTVNKGTTAGRGVNLVNNATRTIGFTSLAITTSNGTGLFANNSGTVNAGGGSITATGGAADLTGTTLGLSFTSVSSTGGVNGVLISGGGGSFASGTTTLTNNTGVSLHMSSSAVVANFGNTNSTGSAGAGVFLSSNSGNITFADLDIAPVANNAALSASSNTGTITASSGTLSTSNAPAINSSSNNLSLVLDSVSASNGGGAQPGVNLTSTNGTVGIAAGTITGGTNSAFLVNSGTVTATYGGGISQANNAALVQITGSHDNTGVAGTGTITFSGTLSATGGTGLQLGTANGVYNFNGTTTLNGGDAGVDITGGSTGTFNFSSNTAITNPSGTAFNVNTGSPVVDYNGTISQSSAGATAVAVTGTTANTIGFDGTVTKNGTGRVVDIDATTGGLVDFNATVTGNNATTGVRVNGITGSGGVEFSTLNLGTDGSRMSNQAVTLTSNTGTGTIALGAINVFTNGATGIGATGNTVILTITSGEVDSSNATAVSIVGAGGGASRTPLNVTLTRLDSVNGANNGVVLTNTSATASPAGRGFRILGTGGTCTVAVPTCSGGTISGKTGASPNADAFQLNNVENVQFTRMNLTNNDGSGVAGVTVNGVLISDSVITNNGDQDSPDEQGVDFTQLLGTATGGSLPTQILNTTISNSFEENLHVANSSGTLTNLNISNCTFSFPNPSNLNGNNLSFIGTGTAVMTMTVNGSIFTGSITTVGQLNNLSGNGIFADTAGGTMTVNAGVTTANTFTNNNIGFGASNSGTGDLVFDVRNSAVTGNRSHGLNVFSEAATTNAGSINGKFINNTVGSVGSAQSGSDLGFGIRVQAEGASQNNILLQNNQVREVGDFEAIIVQQGISGGTAGGSTNATITGNSMTNIGNPLSLARGLTVQVIRAAGGDTMCANISGNTFAGISASTDLRVREVAGNTLNVVQLAPTLAVNANELDDANNTIEPRTSVVGAPAFGQPPCATPPAAPEVPSDDDVQPASVSRSAADDSQSTPAPQQQFEIPGLALWQQAATALILAGGQVDMPPAAQPAPAAPAAKAKQPVDKLTQLTAAKPAKAEAPAPQKGSASRPIVVNPRAGTVTLNIGTLAPGDEVTITFQAQISNPVTAGTTQVANQGQVTATGISAVNTDDPETAAAGDTTVTPVASPPDVTISDASAHESANVMTFTVRLSAPTSQQVTVNFTTADGGVTPATVGTDYTSTSGNVVFQPGQTLQTISVPIASDGDDSEVDETFLVNLTTALNANLLADKQGVGTITAANPPGVIQISELRTSGPAGLEDDYVELYNNSDSPFNVPAGGFGLFQQGAACTDMPVLIATIPATTIPARGHYLITGSGYSLTAVAAGNQNFAVGQTLVVDRNVGLFSTVNAAELSSATRLDAVGFVANVNSNCDLLREGTPVPATNGSTSEHAFFRSLTAGKPRDKNVNATDFQLVSTTPATLINGSQPTLGAPGPERTDSPIQRNDKVKASLIDTGACQTCEPNRVRNTTPHTDVPTGITFTNGTFEFRRRFTNGTGANISRLRFRIVDLTTAPTQPCVGPCDGLGGDVSDLRALSSSDLSVQLSDGVTMLPLKGTTIEGPAQPNGGGLNSAFVVTIDPVEPIGPGLTVEVRFVFGVWQRGAFRFFINAEAGPPPAGALTPEAQKGGGDPLPKAGVNKNGTGGRQ